MIDLLRERLTEYAGEVSESRDRVASLEDELKHTCQCLATTSADAAANGIPFTCSFDADLTGSIGNRVTELLEKLRTQAEDTVTCMVKNGELSHECESLRAR